MSIRCAVEILIRVIRDDILTVSKQRLTEIISLLCVLYERNHSYQNASYISWRIISEYMLENIF